MTAQHWCVLLARRPVIVTLILSGLSDIKVREAALPSGRINGTCKATDPLLPELELVMFDPGWRIRMYCSVHHLASLHNNFFCAAILHASSLANYSRCQEHQAKLLMQMKLFGQNLLSPNQLMYLSVYLVLSSMIASWRYCISSAKMDCSIK